MDDYDLVDWPSPNPHTFFARGNKPPFDTQGLVSQLQLSIRRRSKLSHEQSATSTYAWTLGFLVLLGISVIVFFMTAVGFTT